MDDPFSVHCGGDGGDGGTSNGKCDGGSIAVLGGGEAFVCSWNGPSISLSAGCFSNLVILGVIEVWKICWVVENADFGVISSR